MSGRRQRQRRGVLIASHLVAALAGLRLRGIGPIPSGHVDPPDHRWIRAKNDVSGVCAVMPLTARPYRPPPRAGCSSGRLLVGPKPYLRRDVPFLLPGVERRHVPHPALAE